MLKVANSVINASRITGVLPVANGGTNASTASITSFNNITGFTASGTTGTTSTNLVFATTPTLVGNVTLSTGNLVIGTAGKGIDFAITSSGSGTMTSELLADYEEGTWVPTQGAGLTVVGAFTSSGTYTKIGRLVSVYGTVFGATSVATTAGTIMFAGAPFSAAEISPVGAMNNDNRNVFGGISIFGTTGYSATTIAAGTRIDFSITYSV